MPLVYSYLYSICGDHLLAEEVAQETFFRIVSRCCSTSRFIPERFFRKREPVETQIFYLAIQLLRKELCRKEREVPAEFMLSYSQDMPTMEYLPETTAMYKAEQNEVYEKMRSLKEPIRNVIFLKYYEKRTYKEIAECLDRSENWVKYALTRGKEQLEQMLS